MRTRTTVPSLLDECAKTVETARQMRAQARETLKQAKDSLRQARVTLHEGTQRLNPAQK